MYQSHLTHAKLADILLILEAHVYAPDIEKRTPHGEHGKVIEMPGRPDVGAILRDEFRAQKVRVLVSSKYLCQMRRRALTERVCAERGIRDVAREEVQREDRRHRLIELDFQPSGDRRQSVSYWP